MAKSKKLFHQKRIEGDGSIIEMKIWVVPSPVLGSAYSLKYSLYYGKGGQRIVGYDNDRGKGDHKHLGGKEYSYKFESVEKLISDFLQDIEEMKA